MHVGLNKLCQINGIHERICQIYNPQAADDM